MNRLGDAPTDLLFGLIALHNDLVAPAVIPAALKAKVLEPSRTLAELLVTQGALTPVQRDLVESLSGEYIKRHGGDARQGPGHSDRDPVGPRAARSARRPRAVRQPHRTPARSDRPSRIEPDSGLDDPERTLLPPAKRRGRRKVAHRRLRDPGGAGRGRDGDRLQGAAGAARPIRRSQDDPRRRRARGPRISPGSRPRRRRSPRSNTPTSSRSSRSASTTACPISRSSTSPAAASRRRSAASPSRSMRPPGSSRSSPARCTWRTSTR